MPFLRGIYDYKICIVNFSDEPFVDPTPLLTQAELAELERNAADQVWLISPDLDNDTGEEPLVESIQQTVKFSKNRGIEYVYVVPDNINVRERLTELAKLFNNSNNLYKVIIVFDNIFTFLSDTHIVIFNPMENDNHSFIGFMELPLSQKAWWVKMSTDHTRRSRERVKKLIESPNSEILPN